MPTRVTRVTAHDIRFPTSDSLAGSDAMNPNPDYSAAYVVLESDHPSGLAGHGFTFTIGRGNELCVAAIESLAIRFATLQAEHARRGDDDAKQRSRDAIRAWGERVPAALTAGVRKTK